MISRPLPILLLFADGVGLAAAGGSNPLSAGRTPVLSRLLGGSLTLESLQRRSGLTLAALDATLGVPGLPQSATGQTALFTGVNSSQLIGHHVTALPGPRLRTVIEAHGLFARAAALGCRVTFANAYTDSYLESLATGGHRPSVTTCAVDAARLPFRRVADLLAGRAVSWDVRRDLFGRRSGLDLEPVAAIEAGRHLGALTAEHELTVYETFFTDMAGHGRAETPVGEALDRLDGLVAGVLETAPAELTLLLTSDHGNLEDLTSRAHTRNPVPLLAVGPLAERFAELSSIVDVTPRLLEALSS